MLGLGLGPGVACACIVESVHSLVGAVLAVGMIVAPLLTGAVVVVVVVFGSVKSSERVFRLLRWLRDKEEPLRPPARR
jgi:hypothetical protein